MSIALVVADHQPVVRADSRFIDMEDLPPEWTG
jgi:hypothetical protein